MKCINLLAILFLALTAVAQNRFEDQVINQGTFASTPDEIKGLDVIEKPGYQIPLDLEFTDQNGKKVKLGEYFKEGKPVVINPVYFVCPSTCTAMISSVATAINKNSLRLGDDYTVLTISFNNHKDITETPEVAQAKKENYIAEYSMSKNVEANWHFLIGKENAQAKKLMDELGFQYRWNVERGEYIHPSVTYILTPEGKISRNLYTTVINPNNFKLSLMEAADGRIGTFTDKILNFCFQYDPVNKKYVKNARLLMSISGAVVLVVMLAFFFILFKGDKKRKKAAAEAESK